MLYLIDGHNLFFQQDFATQRDLVLAISRFCTAKGNRAQVVFDGYANEADSTNFVEVEYAGNADARLIKLMHELELGSAVLVSSDRELQGVARLRKFKVVNAEDFSLTSTYRKNNDPGEDVHLKLTDKEVEDTLKEFNNFKK